MLRAMGSRRHLDGHRTAAGVVSRIAPNDGLLSGLRQDVSRGDGRPLPGRQLSRGSLLHLFSRPGSNFHILLSFGASWELIKEILHKV